jgi:3-hydroxyisobutyrate dehydrogenase-like beta-hydroxyacid dehydrogenase
MRIGFIGLGMMGHHMAANLQKAGHDLVVYDVRREAGADALSKGARWAETPADAARQSELVMTSLPGPKEVEAVALGASGILDGASKDAIYVDLSTSSPTLIRRIHAVFAEKGVRVADAPVSGGVVGAEEATLQIMVGCDPDLFDQITPVLRAIGDKITYIGDVGAGEVAKLVHNQIALVVQQVVAEGLTLGTKAGIQPEKLLEAIRGGAYGRGGGGVGPGLERTTLQGLWDQPRFALALARKDLGLATDLASEFGVPMPLAASAEQALIECMNKGWGGKDMTAAWALQEERAQVQVRVKPAAASVTPAN